MKNTYIDANAAIGKSLVEEGLYQGRSFRRYSDGTYKAASSNGWLKFDDFEALQDFHARRRVERQANKLSEDKRGVLSLVKRWFE